MNGRKVHNQTIERHAPMPPRTVKLARGEGLNKVGKRTKRWDNQRARQKKVDERRCVTACQLRLKGCTYAARLSYAHSRKRRFCVKDGLEIVILCCLSCHNTIERLPHEQMEAIVLWVRDHWDEEYFFCVCLKPVTPDMLKTVRDLDTFTGQTCDSCHEEVLRRAA